MRRLLAVVSALIIAVPAAVAQEAGEAPPPPVVDVEGAQTPVDPDIAIVEEEDKTVYEYRDNNGRLYMVKVVPKVGPPYYLLDTDGDGELDTQQYDPTRVAVQMWELFRW